MKDNLHQQKKTISTTIRLHQIKYPERTGIPPVDKGMLMFYNMGKIDAHAVNNSIYNDNDAGKYAGSVTKYPLPLDVVLPVFGWVIHIRDGKVIGLLNKSFIEELPHNSWFKYNSGDTYISTNAFFLHGTYFMKDDVLKIERVLPDNCLKAARKASGSLKSEKRTVSLFDLDSLNISNYHEKDFEKIFTCFD